MRLIRILLSALVPIAMCGSLFAAGDEGSVQFVLRSGTWFDQYTDNPSASTQQWFRDHFWRMQTTSSYFDRRLSWYPNAYAYLDLYGIPSDSPLVGVHPEWILKDSAGHFMFIPFACNGTSCSQYAADPGNAAFRAYWVGQAAPLLKLGYKGLWIDDVNLAFRVSNARGTGIPPTDPRTGSAMTLNNWMQYVADFTKYIRTSFPSTEIVHNSIWFAGPARQQTPQVIEQIQQADYIDCERGVSDSGLTGGTGSWSLNALFGYIDSVHSLGKHVFLDEYTLNGEYGLAGYYMISNGGDAAGDQSMNPNDWWSGYDLDLGAAQNARYGWSGLLRRDFSGGMVLLNPPQSATVTVILPHSFQRIAGNTVSAVTLAAGQGAVLIGADSQAVTSAVRVNAAGPASAPFAADEYSNGGTVASFSQPVITAGVSNAAPQAVYQTKRTSKTAPFTYTIPALEAGHVYTVRLHFADDLSNGVGQRLFNIAINGTPVLTNFDIFSAAGKVSRKAVVEQFSQAANVSGEIIVTLRPAKAGAALISGLEIIP